MWREFLWIAARALWAHKFRSMLTMLGIILGVSSLVAMSALVAGMEKGMTESLIAIGGLQKVRIEPQELPIEQRRRAAALYRLGRLGQFIDEGINRIGALHRGSLDLAIGP